MLTVRRFVEFDHPFQTCFSSQAAVDKDIPVYKEMVKSNIVVRIDEQRFLPSDM